MDYTMVSIVPATRARFDIEEEPQATRVRLTGDWRQSEGLVYVRDLAIDLEGGEAGKRLVLDASAVGQWDSGLVSFLVDLRRRCESAGRELSLSGVPSGAGRLADIALAVPEREGAKRSERLSGFVRMLGDEVIGAVKGGGEFIEFLGETVIALVRAARRKARFQAGDVFLIMHQCGPQALPIITLISLLVGMILAFVGLVQLKQFGADIFVAKLVAVAMVREMGGMMTGIIMSGRTGASFAAQLGTMRVNDEIAAYETLGIPTVEFLVLPRMLALILAVPLLTIYSNVIGMLGGALVTMAMTEISLLQFYVQTVGAVTLVDWAGGLFKASIYGVIIAIAGCLRGMQCKKSASAVGIAATSAVVTSIVLIIIAEAILTVIYTILGV
jgi:phospholipid/cholesterol/gamma-HCH transport system permease protein